MEVTPHVAPRRGGGGESLAQHGGVGISGARTALSCLDHAGGAYFSSLRKLRDAIVLCRRLLLLPGR